MWPFSSTSSSDPFLKGTTADKDGGDRREIESVLRKRLNSPSRLRDCLFSPPPPANVGDLFIIYPKVAPAYRVLSQFKKIIWLPGNKSICTGSFHLARAERSVTHLRDIYTVALTVIAKFLIR